MIDEESSLNFCPYVYTLQGVIPNLLFSRRSGSVPLQPSLSISVGLQYLMVMLAPTSLPSCLESGDSLEAYNPYRFLRQFGFDQRAVSAMRILFANVLEAEAQYAGGGRDGLLGVFTSIF